MLAANAERAGVPVDQLFAGTPLSERLLDPDAENADINVAASFFAAILFYLVRLGSRLYARTLLQTSRRPSYREALRSGS